MIYDLPQMQSRLDQLEKNIQAMQERLDRHLTQAYPLSPPQYPLHKDEQPEIVSDVLFLIFHATKKENKIETIKLIRKLTGFGLKESLQFYTAYIEPRTN